MANSSGMRAGLKGNVEEALRLFSREPEWSGLNLAETEFVLEETLKCYGSTFDGDMIRSLFRFYRRYVGMSDVARRQGLLSRITDFLSDGRQNRFIALLCFLSADPDGQITSGAALDLAMVMPQEKGDPLTGPKYVALHGCGGIRSRMGLPPSDDEGDVAAGLLLLGDMRLLPLMEEIWERLSPEGRRRMVARRSNLVSALMIEFLLRRLEADKDEEHFGELGAALYKLPGIAAQQPVKAVLDIRRNFGLPPGREPMELIAREDLAVAFARFRPRLEALLARETEPKVLNTALAAWSEAAGTEEDTTDDPETEAEEEIFEDDEDEYPDISSQELYDEFEEFSKDDGFEMVSEDISFWGNPYRTKSLNLQQLSREFDNGPLFPLLITGIFNPLGPTLNIYLVQPDAHLEGRWRLSLFTLNPFSCTKAGLGMLDEKSVKIEPGRIDSEASAATGTIVMKGRNLAALHTSVDFVMRYALGKSERLPSFTLCHVLPAQSHEKTLKLVARVYQATARGREDLQDLRDPGKRKDPWARADMAEAMLRAMGRKAGETPARLTNAEAMEMAKLVMDPEQQRIEMLNLLQAWEGAIGFNSGLRPVLGQKMLVQMLVLLSPDLPNLMKIKPEEPVVKPPQLSGLPEKVQVIGFLELLLAPGCAIWAMFKSAWLIAFVLLAFLWVHGFKMRLLHRRQPAARWLGLLSYVVLWVVAVGLGDRLQPNLSHAERMDLNLVIGYWCFGMAILHLLAFDFARQMREAPDEK